MSSKADMMSRYRLDGMEFALKIAKEKGVEGLEEELRFRNRVERCTRNGLSFSGQNA